MAFYEVVLNWDLDGELVQNVLHYDISAVTPLDLQGYVDVIQAELIIHMADILVPSIQFESVTFREDVDGGVGVTITPTTGSTPGTDPNDNYAGQLALIVRKEALSTIRPNLGRIYFGGCTSFGLAQNGRWDTSLSSAAEDFAEAIRGVESGEGGVMDMVIKASNPTAPNTVAYNPVLAMTGLGVPGTQRRRRQGVGV